MLGVRANRVIGGAVLISGLLAAVCRGDAHRGADAGHEHVRPAGDDLVLAGVVLGGLNRPIPATLGGFSIGFAYGLLGGILPTNQSQYLPSFIFAAVIVVLLSGRTGSSPAGGGAVERV